MSDSLYSFLTWMLEFFYWHGDLEGVENLPRRSPAVFVANHMGPVGPIAVFCSIPYRLYPWITADMVDPSLAAEYLRWDFIKPSLGLEPPASTQVARWLSKITVPGLSALGCIPVYKKGHGDIQACLDYSLDLLLQDKYLLIFPEDNQRPVDPLTRMAPFRKTFARMGEVFYVATGRQLVFVPVAVHEDHRVRIGAPELFNPENSVAVERLRIKDEIETRIQTMILDMDGSTAFGSSLMNGESKI